MSLNLYFWMAAALVAIGLGMLVYLFASFTADIVSGGAGWLRRRWKTQDVYRLLGVAEEIGATPAESDAEIRQRITRGLVLNRYFWLAVGVLFAVLAWDALLSPALFVMVNVGGVLYRSRQKQTRIFRINRDTGELILQFSTRYPLSHSIAASLRESLAQLPEDSEVRWVAGEVNKRLRLNQPFEDAVKPFYDLPNPSLHQFGTVIAAAQKTSAQVFAETLEMLRADVENRRDLHNLARQSLALVRGTARVLQIVFAAALIFAALIGSWRTYFVGSTSHMVYYWLAMLGGAIGSLYIEAEITQLES